MNKDELRDGRWWQALVEVGHYGNDLSAPNYRVWWVQVRLAFLLIFLHGLFALSHQQSQLRQRKTGKGVSQ